MRFKLFPAKYEQSYGSENTLKMQAHIEKYTGIFVAVVSLV